MKNVPANLLTHLQKDVNTLAFCWEITFADSTVYGFTSHDSDIVFDSVTYKSKTGFTLDQYKSRLSENSDMLEVLGIIDSDDLSESDINSGRIDNAVLEVFLVNYEAVSDGRILIKKGKVSQISKIDDGYNIGIAGLADELDRNITEIYSPLCRARFGDAKCGKNISSFTFTGSVTEVISEKIFIDSSRSEAKGYFDKGVIKFTSGANTGFTTEVKRSSAEKITLTIPFPNTISVGDAYQITAGCDKKFSTCIDKFNNALNFRGEPHIPGINEIFKVG